MNTSLPILNAATLTPSPVDTSAATTYTDVNGLAQLKRDPTSTESINAVAQQVEAMFLQMMLKSMRDANMGDEMDGNEMSMYQDMFDKQIALTISQHQDIGIGTLLRRQMGSKAGSPKGAHVAAASESGGAASSGNAANATAAESASTPAQFVAEVLPAIRDAATELGVDPRGLLAQAALESGWGQRMPRNADGSSSLNLFGMKAGDGWSGARAVADTVEFSNGVATPRRTAFRAYASLADSVRDFAKVLGTSPRYREAVAAGGNALAYAAHIGKSGYATDPDYANKLNRILNSGALQAALVPTTVKL